MRIQVSEDIKEKFLPSTREGMVVLEAVKLLYGCTFSQAREKYSEIPIEQPFIRNLDVTVWEMRLGELVAEENREEYEAGLEAIKKAMEQKEKEQAKAEEKVEEKVEAETE